MTTDYSTTDRRFQELARLLAEGAATLSPDARRELEAELTGLRSSSNMSDSATQIAPDSDEWLRETHQWRQARLQVVEGRLAKEADALTPQNRKQLERERDWLKAPHILMINVAGLPLNQILDDSEKVLQKMRLYRRLAEVCPEHDQSVDNSRFDAIDAAANIWDRAGLGGLKRPFQTGPGGSVWMTIAQAVLALWDVTAPRRQDNPLVVYQYPIDAARVVKTELAVDKLREGLARLAAGESHAFSFEELVMRPGDCGRPAAPEILRVLLPADHADSPSSTATKKRATVQQTEVEATMPDPKRVFVIYGRNTNAYDQMVKFLRALKLDPKGFYDVSAECGANPTVLQVVRHGMEQAAGVVAMFTADEWAVLRPTLNPKGNENEETHRWQARPNVIFEAGLALGIAEQRTVLVKLGHDVRLFSDAGGIHLVNLDNGHESRNLLRGKLKTAGCQPDMGTGDHLNTAQAGDFETCMRFSREQAPANPFAPPARQKRGKS